MSGSPQRMRLPTGISPPMPMRRNPIIHLMSSPLISEKSVTQDKNLAGALAQKLCRVQFSDFPTPTVHKAKLHLLDTIGVGLAGSTSLETQRVWHGLGLET